MKKISIITICLNAEKYIEQTIKSVIDQKNVTLEYILVDGGSIDKTVEIIKCFESSITRWVSEPDSGIADAMNKGLSLSTGDYVLFLHADDYFFNENVVREAIKHMENRADIYAFDILYKKANHCFRHKSRKLDFLTLFKTPVLHQGAFCKKQLLEKLGGFNASYKTAMDYDFFLRARMAGASIVVQHDILSVMRDTGISSRQDWPSLKQRFAEEKRIHLENNTSAVMRVIYAIYWAMYLPYRKALFITKHI